MRAAARRIASSESQRPGKEAAEMKATGRTALAITLLLSAVAEVTAQRQRPRRQPPRPRRHPQQPPPRRPRRQRPRPRPRPRRHRRRSRPARAWPAPRHRAQQTQQSTSTSMADPGLRRGYAGGHRYPRADAAATGPARGRQTMHNAESYGFDLAATEHGAVVVYPQGKKDPLFPDRPGMPQRRCR